MAVSQQQVIEEERDEEMDGAATLIGRDSEMCDVEYAFAAQSEVALVDDLADSQTTNWSETIWRFKSRSVGR